MICSRRIDPPHGRSGWSASTGPICSYEELWPLASISALEAHGLHVDVEERLLLLAVGGIHAAQAHDLAHDLGFVAGRLRFGIDFADIAGKRGALFFQPLDPLDEGFQSLRLNGLLAGHAALAPCRCHGTRAEDSSAGGIGT